MKNKKCGVAFKIYADNKKYYKVFITSTKNQMYYLRDEIAKIQNIAPLKHRYLGVCSWYQHKDKRFKNQIGSIHFYLDSSKRAGIVAHELAHAALYYWMHEKKKKLDVIKKSKYQEEKFCHLVGNLSAHYWNNWYKNTKKVKV